MVGFRAPADMPIIVSKVFETRKALADFGPEMETDYRAQVDAAALEVETALATDGPGGFGDLKRLLASVAALDEATRPLADFLMDKAMEAALRRRGLIQ